MAFTIKRQSLEDVAAMKNAAAQAKTNVAVDMQNREFAFRNQSEMASMQFQQTMREQDFQNKLEIAGMTQEANKQAAIQAHQMDLARIEMQEQADFERMVMQQNMIKDRILENKLARADEMENKLTALDKAYAGGTGDISTAAYNAAKLKLITGYSQPRTDPMQELLNSMMGGGGMGGPTGAPTGMPQPGQGEVYPQPEQMTQMMQTDPNAPGVTTLKHLAAQPAYETKTSKWPWVKDKQVPNIPVMKAKLTAAMGSDTLDDQDKQALLMLLQTGSDKAIEQAWLTLTAQVETGAYQRASYEGPQL
jgi:hypothetical protein